MANLNKVLLIGRLTQDPRLRHTHGGTPVTEAPLAINREFTTVSGDRRKEAVFVDLVFWGRSAEVVAEYARTGSTLCIEGRLELDQWTSTEGEKRSRLRVVSEHFQFLDRRPKNGDSDGNNSSDSEKAEWDKAAADVSEETPEEIQEREKKEDEDLEGVTKS